MSETIKYVLIGGAVAAAVYFVATRNSAGGSGGVASGPNRLAEDLNAGTGLLGSLSGFIKTVRGPAATGADDTTNERGELTYNTRTTSPDGIVPSTTDAMGYRSRRALLSAPELLTRSQEQLIGIH